MTLRPDAFAAWVCGDWELAAFFEVDQATEHPGRIKRKVDQYSRYWRTGTEQRDHDIFPSVVWITPTERRADVLRSVVVDRLAEGPLDEKRRLIEDGWLNLPTPFVHPT